MHQGPILGNSMLAGGSKVMRGNGPNELVADLIACNTYQNGATVAAGIGCPRQVILAGQDRMAPRKAKKQFLVSNLIYMQSPAVSSL